MDEGFTDDDSRKLLNLLHAYVINYAPDIPQTIPALASDLAESLDETDDLADSQRMEIEALCQ
jgi:hypothetical protein